MLKDVVWASDGTYRPGEKFSPERFFNDGLKNSCSFDLQLGYFSSATISVLADGFATFISKGGNMRLVINQIVSEEDKDALVKGSIGGLIDCIDLTNFEQLRKTFDEYQEQFFKCLAYLISLKRIEIRIIRPKNKIGIAHTKSGQFRDGDSITSFTGSANFTINGLFNNIEEIKIDRSDSLDLMTQNRIVSQRKSFQTIMDYERMDIEYLSPNELSVAVASSYSNTDINELLDAERDLAKLKQERMVEKAIESEGVCDEIHMPKVTPCFPYDKPREYQVQAFENWKANKQKGLFAMATGTGKTITSLNCLLEIYKRNGYYKAIILVPTITLVEQWEKECLKFHFQHIVLASSKNKDWYAEVSKISMMEKLANEVDDNNYIIISTYASFVRKVMFDLLNTLPKKKVLLIADEAHNMGSNLLKEKLPFVNIIRRIGLSATPSRQYDFEGNRVIKEFFRVESGYYTFEYTMEEAIKNGVLCKYYYYPHLVELTEEEMMAYSSLSEKIAKYLTIEGDSFKNDPILTALLLKRKRIIHKAANKKKAFEKIVRQRYQEKGNLKYTLVYVPEGSEPENEQYDYVDNVNIAEKDSEHLIDGYTKIISEVSERVTVREFTAGSKDRNKILRQFANGELDVLTSMKCLDEGVDVPRSEMAIFCSSTGNPRQFIQRRGRILRTHPDKHIAVIHDLVVAPMINQSQASFKTEQNLLKNELKRVQNFALLSENSSDSVIELEDVINYYGLSIFDV